jgi:hypothetical protein
MRVPRLLVLTLVISSCSATAAAQTSPRLTGASLNLFQFQLDPDFEASILSQPAQTPPSDTDAVVTPVMGPHTPFRITIYESDLTCLTLRTYRVAREHPNSDVVRPAGYSTCQPSSRFQVKTAVESREIAPR